MKKENVYLDLSKLTKENQNKAIVECGLNLNSDDARIDYDYKYLTLCRFGWFVDNSDVYKEDKTEVTYEQFISLFKTYPRVMEVSSDKDDWVKRVVFMEKNSVYLAWNFAETLEDSEKMILVTSWKYAREIEEPKKLELTLEQIAEKFGEKVENILIKK